MEAELERFLKEHDIHYELYSHPPVFTVSDSKKLTNHIPGTRTKNLFLKDENNKYYLVSLPAEKMLDSKSFKKTMGIKSLSFASPEELKQELNVYPGSVSLFALIHAKGIRFILDKALWDAPRTASHPNLNTETIVVSHNDLEKFFSSLKISPEVIPLE